MHTICSNTQYKNESKHSEMDPMRQNPIQRTVRSVHMCVCWFGMEKLNPNTTKTHIHQSNQKKCTTTQNKHRKLKPGLVASYDVQPGNGEGLFCCWRFINLSLTYLDTYPLTYSPGTHMGQLQHDSSGDLGYQAWPNLW